MTAAGIRPENYLERSKSFSVVGVKTPTGHMWLRRHTPDEYLEFFEKLDDACNEMLALEANFAKLVPVANKWSTMSASAPPTDWTLATSWEGASLFSHGL